MNSAASCVLPVPPWAAGAASVSAPWVSTAVWPGNRPERRSAPVSERWKYGSASGGMMPDTRSPEGGGAPARCATTLTASPREHEVARLPSCTCSAVRHMGMLVAVPAPDQYIAKSALAGCLISLAPTAISRASSPFPSAITTPRRFSRRSRAPACRKAGRARFRSAITSGSGGVTVHLVSEQDYQRRTIWDVIGKIKGSEYPDEWVVAGNHRDAWVYGAVDPSSGTAAMLEAVHGVGELLRKAGSRSAPSSSAVGTPRRKD